MLVKGVAVCYINFPASINRSHCCSFASCTTSVTHLKRQVLQRHPSPFIDCSTPTMALPLVRTVAECADFNRVVTPYLPQLQELPSQIWASITDPSALYEIYLQTNPLITSLAFALALAPIVLILSEINGNYSQIDRLWSLLPTIYNAHYTWYAHAVGLPTQKIDSICTFSVLWSVSTWTLIAQKQSPLTCFIYRSA